MTAISNLTWQTGFLSVLPAVQTHAQIRFRKLPAQQREDAIAEAIASACISYQLLAAQGKLHVAHPSTLARFAVHHVRSGRHVGGCQDAAGDVLSPAAQVRHRFATRRLADEGDNEPWRLAMLSGRQGSIPETAAFRIDFGRWLKSQCRRDRRIIAAMTAGERTSALASRFGLSASRISQLRRAYEQRWQCFQGEAPGEPAHAA